MTTSLNGATDKAPMPVILCDRCRCEMAHGLSVENHRAIWRGKVIPDTTVTERRVITLLYTNAYRYVGYREIYDVIQRPGFTAGEGPHGYKINVRSCIKRLRKKLSKVTDLELIRNAANAGYRWTGGE